MATKFDSAIDAVVRASSPTAKRKAIEAIYHDKMETFDPSGRNTARMDDRLSSMSYEEFIDFMYRYYTTEMLPAVGYLPYDNPVNLDFARKVAKTYGVPVEETVYEPYVTGDADDPPGTPNPQTVIDCVIKRLKQASSIKNHASVSALHRDARTQQISGDDKTARISDAELYSLMAMGAYNVAKEYYGPMGDDVESFNAMTRAIQRDGYVTLEELPNNPENRMTADAINAMMIASGLCSNLIMPDGITLPVTINASEDEARVLDKS